MYFSGNVGVPEFEDPGGGYGDAVSTISSSNFFLLMALCDRRAGPSSLKLFSKADRASRDRDPTGNCW